MDLHQSLFDIIGILIGFVSILLLLSLVVTSLVQAFQSGLRLRARNLKHGLQSIITTVLDKPPAEAGDLALHVLNASNICILCKKDNPTGKINKLIGPVVTYIDPKELPNAFKEVGAELIGDLENKVLSIFDKMWNQLENRFLKRIRLLTILCSLVVAGYFQISAPALLSRLSVDEALRAQIVADAPINTKAEFSIPHTYENLSEKALSMLGTEFPEIKEKIGEVSGIGETKSSLVSDLEQVVADSGPTKDKVVARYEAILDGLYAERRDAALKKAEAVMGKLSKYDISGWPQGKEFYFKDGSVEWSNVIGVLFTGILLSFGAPFWFERLKEVVKLKDTLSKGIKPEEKQPKA